MSASVTKLKMAPARNSGDKGPGDIPLNFKNVGLFSDPFLDELVNERINEPFLLRSWATEGLPDFSKAYEWMLQYWGKYKDMMPQWSEAELEDKWVRPLLQQLGWTYQAQVRVSRYGKREIPDYALFDSDESYQKAQKPYGNENYDAFFSHVLAVADAKRFGVSLDGSKQDNSNPSYQIVWYQQITGKKWGILTDGMYWRLYSASSKNKFSSYYEVNISKFLEDRDDEAFKVFYNFFRKDAFLPESASGQSFLDVVFANGERYASEVEKKLKERAFHLVEMICQGFVSSKKTYSDEELKNVYQHSLYYLFRLLFVLNAEAKGLLNIGNQSDYYPHSLRKLCEDLRNEFERGQNWASVSSSYNKIIGLFELIESGDERIGIHGLGTEVFSSGDSKFFSSNKISDEYLNKALLELSCLEGNDGKWRFVDYKRLSSDHLGSIFEGLLEFSLVKFKGAPSGVALVNAEGERKSTGAYYTPDYIVDHIVDLALAPLVRDKTPEEILELKVMDPAMGSGHFLLGAIRYLEDAIMNANGPDKNPKFSPTTARWNVVKNCIFGVDINPLAVELAKFSVWLFTLTKEQALEPLADQLVCKDSLLEQDKILGAFKGHSIKDGFNAVVGNPPYVNTFILAKSGDDYKTALRSKYQSASGAFDICALFVESAKKHSPNSRIGFILPSKLASSKNAAGMRKFVLGSPKAHIEYLEDLSDLTVFDGASTYPMIIVLGTTKVSNALTRKHAIEFDESLKFKKKKPGDTSETIFTDILHESFESNVEMVTLSSIVKDVVAAATVDEAYKVIKPNVSDRTYAKGIKFIVSGNIGKFFVGWSKEKTRYLKEAFNSPSLNLNAIPARRRDQYSSPKIIVPNMTQVVRAYLDLNGEFAPGISTTMITGDIPTLKAVTVFLNSDIATAMYKAKFASLHLNGGALSIGATQLSDLHVPKFLADKAVQKSLAQHHDKIVSCINAVLKKPVTLSKIKKDMDVVAEGSKLTELGAIKKLMSEVESEIAALMGVSEGLKKAS